MKGIRAMKNGLRERCSRALEAHVSRPCGDDFDVEWLVRDFHPMATRRQLAWIDAWAGAALAARAWFKQVGPDWAQPLLLIYDEIEDCYCSGDFRKHVVMYFSDSLRGRNYDYVAHPCLDVYARGVMAHKALVLVLIVEDW